jgi:hypothetical protein
VVGVGGRVVVLDHLRQPVQVVVAVARDDRQDRRPDPGEDAGGQLAERHLGAA